MGDTSQQTTEQDLQAIQPKRSKTVNKHPWRWIPTLYFSEGLPYFVVVVLSVILYKRFGLSNTEIAFYTAWFYLPWVIKPLWSPFVDLFATRRIWIISLQLLMGAGLAAIALTLPLDNYLAYSLAFFWLLAFSSATHDIAADGFYIETLNEGDQAFFVGIRSTFYRIAMITGQGLIVVLAGLLEDRFDIVTAWQITLSLVALVLVSVAIYHALILPKAAINKTRPSTSDFLSRYGDVFRQFFSKEHIGLFIAFMLLYRLGEAQLTKIASLFLLDERAVGGLGLSTEAVGFIYGTVGVASLVTGGILGGIAVSRHGLKYWLWPMALAINLPDLVYIYMAWVQPNSLLLINSLVAVEQFGYGFGFTAFMLYLIYIAQGEYKTAHYAIATGFMAAGMMIPGMVSGWIQEALGYPMFFVWVMIATLPAFYIISKIPLPATFGKKRD